MSDMFERLSNLSPKRLALVAMELQERLDEHEQATVDPVAVIGMGCRLPGASNPDEYWQLLLDGVDAIDEVPASRWDVEEFYDPDPDAPGKMVTRFAGMLDDVASFEPELFGISPREAKSMDPQQRLLLEVAWEALENAGIAPDAVHGSDTGAYVGVCNIDYARLLMDGDASDLDMYLSTGNAASVASGRLSYVLGLQGPAMTIDTACSSSLVAIHLAAEAVRTGACRMALAGGANVILSPKSTVILSQAKMMAPDGRCKTFDAAGDGFVRSEGCGIVALKRLSDARADGDRVMAVIRGSAVNQDGRSNGLTAPNGPSQVAVLRAALAAAGVEPDEVGYVEAHGTGTPLGDPIEIQALGAALGAGRDASNRLVVGSAKSNLGHLEAAAGVAGLIKLILTVQHGEFPPLLHLDEPNPFIPWDDLPIDVPTTRTPWRSVGRRIGGVSSFGFSGTNAHVLVEAAPDTEPSDAVGGGSLSAHLLTLGARTPDSLVELAERIGAVLGSPTRPDIADVERTLNLGRSHLAHRLAVVAPDTAGAGHALEQWAAGVEPDPRADAQISTGVVSAQRAPDVGFLFTGHGSHFPGMGRSLYEVEGPFRAAIDHCEELLTPLMDVALTTVMYDDERAEELLADMAYAQPAVFAIEYALSELWRSWGLRPSIVAGHSVGEYVAAVVAGAMSLDDGIRLVAARGRLMATLPPDGEMATVFASEERVRAALSTVGGSVTIAAINGPASIALSGTGGRLQPTLDALRADGVEVRPLAIPIAAHSPQIDPILDEFEAVAARVEFRTPQIDVVSGMTGAIATGDDLVTASYWRRHLRQPVRFADAFRAMHERGVRTFVEVGPHPTLLNMARHIVDERECRWLPSLRSGHDDRRQLLGSVAELHVAGVDLEWARINAPGGSVVTLPTYPFERQRHWVETRPARRSHSAAGEHPLLGSRVQSPALVDAVFENSLGAAWPAFLDHHRVYGTAIMPTPAYLEMALAAGSVLDGADSTHSVERFEIREPLILPDDGERIVQLVLRDGAEQAGRDFDVFSRPTDGDDWTLHATGRLSTSPPPADATGADFDDVRSRCTEHVDGAAYYERLAELGLEFGRSFRGVSDVWRRDGEALGRVTLTEELLAESTDYGIHPAMLDACFHVLGAAMNQVDDETHLLIGADEFRLHAPPGTQLWNHTLLHDDADSGLISGDIRLYDDDGRLVAEALGLHLRPARRDTLMRTAKRVARDWTYQVEWHEAPPPDDSDRTDGGPTRWIIVGDGDGLGAATVDELDSRSIANTHVRDASSLDLLGLDPDQGPVRVLHVAATDPSLDATTRTVDALHTFQWFRAAGGNGEIWLVTRNAQTVGDASEHGTIDEAHAPIWGLGRVIGLEHPDLWGGLIDLDTPDVESADVGSDAAGLVDAIDAAAGEDQLALRGATSYAARLVRSSHAATAPVEWRTDASYLVTGGLGGLGLQLLGWLADNGAGTIVLTGRNGLPDRDRWDDAEPGSRLAGQVAAVRAAEAAGATVVPIAADVADRDDMDALFARFGTDLAPLAGVIHAATVLHNATTDAMTADDVRSMLRPKVTGTRLLHELTQSLTLDFFVMFSSTSAIWGSRELGHYAAANQYLDALAHRRHTLGLPAMSIDWGTWDEMRDTSNEDRAEVLHSGMHPLPTDDALACLGELLGCPDAAQVVVAAVDWNVLKPVYEARRLRPLLSTVAPPATDQRSARQQRDAGPPRLAAELAELEVDARHEHVVNFLRTEVAHALGVTDPRSIDDEQGLFEMGMDSLMSVELKSRIEAALGTDLPSTLTFNYPNIAALAGFVVDDVLTIPVTEATPESSSDLDESTRSDRESASTDDLSENELADMLARRLSDLGS